MNSADFVPPDPDPRAEAYRFRQLCESLPALVWSAHADGSFDYLGPQWRAYTGQPESELLGGWLDCVHPEDRGRLLEIRRAAAAERRAFDADYRLRRHDGVWRWFRTQGAPYCNAAGRVLRWSGADTDIDERKRAETRLRDNEDRFRQVLNQIPDAVILYGPDYRVRYANNLVTQYTGFQVPDILGLRDDEYLPPEVYQTYLPTLRRTFESGTRQSLEAEITLPKTGSFFLNITCIPLFDANGELREVLGVTHDLTEHKHIEEALRESQADLNRAQAVARIGSGRYDLARNETIFSDEALRILGIPAGIRTTHELFSSLVYPDDRNDFEQKWTSARRGEPFDMELRLKTGDRMKWVRVKIELELDEKHAPRDIFGTIQDVTERKRVEQALQESETRLRLAQRAGQIGVFDWDIPEDKHYWSEETQTIFGFRAATMSTARVRTLYHPDDRSAIIAVLERVFSEHRTEINRDYRILRPDGEIRWLNTRGLITYDDAGRPLRLIGTVSDITVRKMAEEALREADRHKDEFLAMLAHELRNPLAPIRNAVYLLRQAGVADPFLRRQRDVIDRQVTHMTRLLEDLLDVSRLTRGLIVLRKQPLLVSRALFQAMELVQPLIAAKRHTLHYTPPPEDLSVDADPDRFVQIVGNLLTNAAKYTPDGGEIWLQTRRENQDAVICVSDSGIGIDAGILPHVFEIFSQARRSLDRSQGGLGIGLTIVDNLVKLHGGSVEARSRGPGHGSEFIVRIPALHA